GDGDPEHNPRPDDPRPRAARPGHPGGRAALGAAGRERLVQAAPLRPRERALGQSPQGDEAGEGEPPPPQRRAGARLRRPGVVALPGAGVGGTAGNVRLRAAGRHPHAGRRRSRGDANALPAGGRDPVPRRPRQRDRPGRRLHQASAVSGLLRAGGDRAEGASVL
ncbi:MAG: 2,4'-dihydroxyacetophenone dioxygenase, partial [uncultured Thermomicrobiales bacterium]